MFSVQWLICPKRAGSSVLCVTSLDSEWKTQLGLRVLHILTFSPQVGPLFALGRGNDHGASAPLGVGNMEGVLV